MPKGSTPSQTMNQRYNRMVAENNRAFNKKNRLGRKIVSMLKGDDAAVDYLEKKRGEQRVVTGAEYERTKKMRKYEKTLLRRGNSS